MIVFAPLFHPMEIGLFAKTILSYWFDEAMGQLILFW